MRAVFLGTPEAAVPSLVALSEIAEVGLVVTRPDRPRGRSRRPQPPPVRRAAERMELATAQPADRAELVAALEPLDVEVGVVVAFGMLIPAGALALASAGFVNVHFSLLPRWRGAAPVERAIIAGDAETGVTLMQMDAGLDTGPIIAQRVTPIGATETGGGLRERLAAMGAALLRAALPDWMAGRLVASPQPDTGVTYAAKLDPADRLVGPGMSLHEFTSRVRALAPQPGARLWIEGEPHKLLAVSPDERRVPPGVWHDGAGGTPLLGLADGAVRIDELQPPGKRPMSGAAWRRGRELPSAPT